MVYLIQAEEQEISYDLTDRLATVMAESPDLIHADGMYRLHHAHGILEVPDQVEAERLVPRFTELGFPCFVVDKLLELPPPEDLHLEHPALDQGVEFVVAARVATVIEHREADFNPLRANVMYPTLPAYGPPVQTRVVEENDAHYYADLATRTQRWRTVHDLPAPVQQFLSQTEFPGAFLSQGAEELRSGKRNLPEFQAEADYERYVTWLYQVRYAPR